MYATTMTPGSTLLLPLQAEPVDRTPAGAAAFTSAAGVEASQDLLGTALQLLPSVLGAFGI